MHPARRPPVAHYLQSSCAAKNVHCVQVHINDEYRHWQPAGARSGDRSVTIQPGEQSLHSKSNSPNDADDVVYSQCKINHQNNICHGPAEITAIGAGEPDVPIQKCKEEQTLKSQQNAEVHYPEPGKSRADSASKHLECRVCVGEIWWTWCRVVLAIGEW